MDKLNIKFNLFKPSENYIKKHLPEMWEFDDDSRHGVIDYPCEGEFYCITFDDEDAVSTAACIGLVAEFVQRDCRVLGGYCSIYINTAMSFSELERIINEYLANLDMDRYLLSVLNCEQLICARRLVNRKTVDRKRLL